MGPFWSKFSELHVLRKRGCGTKGFGASIWKYLDDYAHESINLSWWHVLFFAVTWVFWLKVKPKTLNFKVVQRRNSYRNTLKYHKKISIFWVVNIHKNIHKTCIKHPQFPAILVWKTSEFPPEDMGWTACSKQGEASNFGRIEGYPQLKVVNLKQEAPAWCGRVKNMSEMTLLCYQGISGSWWS